MNIFINYWWIIAIVVLLIGIITKRAHKRRKLEAQRRADKSTILNLYNDMPYEDFRAYRDLPNREARVDWLKRHHPDFIEAAERYYDDGNLFGVIAVHLDFRILKGLTAYTSKDRALSGYQFASYQISLNEYQQKLDIFNEEQARLRKIEEAHAAKLRAERAERQRALEVAAKAHWDSLSVEGKEAFKKAQGKSERQKALGSTTSTGYSTDVLYPLIMATEFSGINTNSHNSIDYCQSDSYSSFHDGGGHSSFGGYSDGGSSYSDGGSSSCDGGGGGGGGD